MEAIAPAAPEQSKTYHEHEEFQDDKTITGDVQGEVVAKKTIVQSDLAEVLMKERPSMWQIHNLAGYLYYLPRPLVDICYLDPWAKHMIKLYLILIPAYLCSTTNGFDSNTFGGASALPAFIDYFNLTQGNTQGLLASMYVVGNIAGSFVAGQIADRWGRRVGMGLGSAICVIGAVLQVAANGGDMLIVGRVILGIGAIICQTAAPAYVVEFAHPAYRAILTGFYQAMFFS